MPRMKMKIIDQEKGTLLGMTQDKFEDRILFGIFGGLVAVMFTAPEYAMYSIIMFAFISGTWILSTIASKLNIFKTKKIATA